MDEAISRDLQKSIAAHNNEIQWAYRALHSMVAESVDLKHMRALLNEYETCYDWNHIDNGIFELDFSIERNETVLKLYPYIYLFIYYPTNCL